MARTKKVKKEENKIQKIVDMIPPIEKIIDWNGITIHVKSRLTINEIVSFAHRAVELCFTDTHDYLPEVLRFAVGLETINFYTDLELPESIDDKYTLITQTDLIECIIDCVDKEQYEEIVTATDEKLNYRADSAIAESRKEVEEIYSAAKTLFDKISEAFSGLDPDDFKNMVTAISANGIDESKIMEAYLTHKKD